MINITQKADCCGCGACAQRCPKGCITMVEDEQGFRYPKVDLDTCIDCHLCERVCPVLNQSEPRKPVAVYAAKNLNKEERMHSSSGGIFIALAKQVIADGGVVFGARFDDNWEVCHAYADTIEGVRAFMGSKYVQSRIGNTYSQAEEFLKAGRRVMFTGTPCQLAGLRLYLRKDYGEQLLKVDVVCHGAPSPRVWRDYLKHITRPQVAPKNTDSQPEQKNDETPVITSISFRDKRISWEKFGFTARAVARQSDQNTDSQPCKSSELLFEPLSKNVYMKGFLKDLYLRPSCYACPTKSNKSESDLTLADFWGIEHTYPQLYDEIGVSLVLANTMVGQSVLSTLVYININEVDYNVALAGNPSIERSVTSPKQRTTFWNRYHNDGITCIEPITDIMRPTLVIIAKNIAKSCIRHILGKDLYTKIKPIIKR